MPGLMETKCVALVRNLPKALRKNFVPVPDFVKAALQRMVFAEGSLPQALGRELLRMTGVRVTDEAWAEAAQQVESHLKMNLEVVDGQGKFLGEGRELAELTARFAEARQAALAVPQSAKGQQPVEAKGFAAVAEKTQQKIAGLSMTVYPALVEEGGTVKEGRFSTQAEAEYQHRRALQRLLLQQLAEPTKFLRSKLPGQTELALLYRDLGRVDGLIEDILLASLDSCILEGEATLPRDGAGLLSLAERKRGGLTEHAERLAKLTLEILKLWHGLQKRFKGKIDLAQAVALNDIKGQLSKLVYPGFRPRNAGGVAQGVAALPQGHRVAPRETRQPGAEGPGLERRTGQPLGAVPDPRRQTCPGRQARPGAGGVSLVAGGIPRVAVCPATGHQSADLGQTPEQAVDPGRGLIPSACSPDYITR